MSKTYRVNEIFYSIQGEGVRAGTAAVFVRFSGCNLRCTKETVGFDCDTDHDKYEEITADEILTRALKIGGKCNWVTFTGGEPLLQLDKEIVTQFINCRYHVALETNGTLPLPLDQLAFGWVAVSPKRGKKVVIHYIHELRVVLAAGEELWEPDGVLIADHKVISPAFTGPKGDILDLNALTWCIDAVKKNPSWRLSVQQHKGWRIR